MWQFDRRARTSHFFHGVRSSSLYLPDGVFPKGKYSTAQAAGPWEIFKKAFESDDARDLFLQQYQQAWPHGDKGTSEVTMTKSLDKQAGRFGLAVSESRPARFKY